MKLSSFSPFTHTTNLGYINQIKRVHTYRALLWLHEGLYYSS